MLHRAPRTDFTGPALIRLLAGLAAPGVAAPRQSFAERLSQWLGWTDAIALSAALGSGSAGASDSNPADTAAADCARVRSALLLAIGAAVEPGTDFAAQRRCYAGAQQAMDAAIAALRWRLRKRLAARAGALSRLAAVDAVLAQVLGPRERSLLATIPALLQPHYQRLRETAAHSTPDTADTADTDAGGAWLQVFRTDMQAVLRAELELRMQPAEGLRDALGRPSPRLLDTGTKHA